MNHKQYQCTDYKGNTNTYYSRSLGNNTYHSRSLEGLNQLCEEHKERVVHSKEATFKAIQQFGTSS